MRTPRRLKEAIVTVARNGGGPPEKMAEIHGAMESLPSDERLELCRWIATELEVDPKDLEEPLTELAATRADPLARSLVMNALRDVLRSPRREFLEGFSHLPGGVEFVLQLRAQVLEAQRSGESKLEPFERDLTWVLNGWFRHGFLRLGEIDASSPFQQIRFLKERELVHPMVALEDMGRRLGTDRRCFALYHCLIPDAPVVFIEVALTKGMVGSIHDIIDETDGARPTVERPDTAIFYSINNTQNGLAGLGLGKVLVFRVKEALTRTHPGIRRFATLSPIPGFWPRYLRPVLDGEERFKLRAADVVEALGPRSESTVRNRWLESGGEQDAPIASILRTVLDRSDWVEDEALVSALAKPLEDIAFRYLTEETDRRGKPLNPVAGFHLGNGATVARRNVHSCANRSERGVAESCSLMVNYSYSATWFQRIGRGVINLLPTS